MGLVFAFDLSRLISQACSFGSILFGFDTELNGTDAAKRIVEIVDAVPVALIRRHAVPGQGPSVVGLYTSLVLIHPADWFSASLFPCAAALTNQDMARA